MSSTIQLVPGGIATIKTDNSSAARFVELDDSGVPVGDYTDVPSNSAVQIGPKTTISRWLIEGTGGGVEVAIT